MQLRNDNSIKRGHCKQSQCAQVCETHQAMKRRKPILIQIIIASIHNNTKHALVDAREINQTDRIIRADMPRIKGYKVCKRKIENVKRSKKQKTECIIVCWVIAREPQSQQCLFRHARQFALLFVWIIPPLGQNDYCPHR